MPKRLNLILELEDLKSYLTRLMKENEKEVKTEIVKLLNAEDRTPRSSPAEIEILSQHQQREERVMGEKEQRTILRMDQVKEKAQILRSKLNQMDDPKQMHNSEVCEKLLESKEWEKTQDGIITMMEKMQEDGIGTGVDLKPMTDRVEAVSNLLVA